MWRGTLPEESAGGKSRTRRLVAKARVGGGGKTRERSTYNLFNAPTKEKKSDEAAPRKTLGQTHGKKEKKTYTA